MRGDLREASEAPRFPLLSVDDTAISVVLSLVSARPREART